MRRSMLVVCALLTGTTLGCDAIKQAIDKRRNANRAPATRTAARDTTKRSAPSTTTPPGGAQPGQQTGGKQVKTPTPAPTPETPRTTRTTASEPTPAAPAATTPRPMVSDEPYNSPDTGTIAPGMSVRDVETLWGAPAAVRNAGAFTYMHYPNGCEHSCGTDDIVILQNNQVVDAVLRWHGHGYSGESSSPPGRTPEPTRP